MEKAHRLFVRNLPLNINEGRVEELFGKYVTLKNINLKEKKDIDDKINKFAFINVTATDKQINTCFQELNGERIDGFEISVELAKESFLDRLKRERNEHKLKNDKPIIPAFEESPKTISFNNTTAGSKSKRKTFCDTDLQLDDSEVEKIKKDSEKEFKKYKNPCEENNSAYIKSEQTDFKKYSDTNTNKNHTSFEKNLHEKESSYAENRRKLQNKRKFIDGHKFPNHSTTVNNVNNSDVQEINESEKKRLMSLKQKRSVFKAQEQTIRAALKGVDNNKSNKKIIFDDDIDIQENSKETKKSVNNTKSNMLFDSDDDENDEKFEWNEDELAAKAKLKNKLLKLQTNIGNDKRFALDERFVDDDDDDNKIDQPKEDNAEDSSILDERKWQLDILGNILGKSVTAPPTDNNNAIKKKNKMVRYDPTASNHQDFEVIIEKSKEKPVKKKRKSSITEVQENPPIPTSKEVFYDVSDKLVESLKQNEGFSLLKSLGRDSSNLDDSTNTVIDAEKSSGEGFKFSFSSKSPFKYDSSDDEGENDTNDVNALTKSTISSSSTSRQNNDRLFFTHNDTRFEEAKQFFHNQSALEVEFKRRRQELKVIVRSKIRNNLKKTVPWNKKKVRKMHKVKSNK